MNDEHTTRRSRRERRTGKTDWQRLDTLTDADLAQAIACDPDAAPIVDEAWFDQAEVVTPGKERISIRLDKDVLEFFRAAGDSRYQTRINAVLRAYVEHHRKAG